MHNRLFEGLKERRGYNYIYLSMLSLIVPMTLYFLTVFDKCCSENKDSNLSIPLDITLLVTMINASVTLLYTAMRDNQDFNYLEENIALANDEPQAERSFRNSR